MTLKLFASLALVITVAYQALEFSGLIHPPPPAYYSYGSAR